MDEHIDDEICPLEAAIAIAEAWEDDNRYARAASIYESLVQTYPDDSSLYLSWGGALELANRLTQADEAYERLLQLDPENIQGLIRRSRALCRDKRFGQALPLAEKALALLPDDWETHWQTAACLWKLGRLGSALLQFDQALELLTDQGDPEYRFYLYVERGDVLDELERREEARHSYERARAAAPHEAQPLFRLGHLAFDRGDYHEALQLFLKALELDPWDLALQVKWIRTLQKTGRKSAARRAFRQFLALRHRQNLREPDPKGR